jgi:hypothetical protein
VPLGLLLGRLIESAVGALGTSIPVGGSVVSVPALVGAVAVAIGGYLVLGTTRWAVAALAWLYRWPLFVPFIIAAQCMRTFLAKNGLMNNSLIAAGLMPPEAAQGFLDWRGIVITFVWKQAPVATLMVAGAMAALAAVPSACVPTWTPCPCRSTTPLRTPAGTPAPCTPAGMTATPPCCWPPGATWRRRAISTAPWY